MLVSPVHPRNISHMFSTFDTFQLDKSKDVNVLSPKNSDMSRRLLQFQTPKVIFEFD